MLCVPMFGDQPLNARVLEVGLKVETILRNLF